MEKSDPPSDDRRKLLLCLGAGVLSALCGEIACRTSGPPQSASDSTRVPLTEVPPDSRRVVVHRGLAVEIVRQAGTLKARSLQCTHMGCQVAWKEALGMYRCPCHDGRYDAEGRPMYGPPTRPLDEIPARIEGDEIVLGG